MKHGPAYEYDDLRNLRRDVHEAVAAGRVLYNLRYVKSKGHIEVTAPLIDALLVGGAYRFDPGYRRTRNRFHAYGRYLDRECKVVFSMIPLQEERTVFVITAYEVDVL